MSRRGSAAGGRGNDNRPPRRDPLAMREEEGLGPHWSMLRDEAGVAVRTALFGEDDDRYNAVMDNLHHLQGIEREPNEHDHDLMARLISIFLDRAGLARRAGGLDALDALFWVTDAEWDIETALNDLAAAEEEGRNPELDFDELEEESMAESDESVSDAFDDMPQQYRAINRLNPDVDRKPAIKGQRTPEKLEINLTMPGDDGLKTLRFNKFNRGADMDWSKAEHIRELNRWRTQQLRRDLGPVREGRIYFHPDERLWLTELYRLVQQDFLDRGKKPDFRTMKWDELTADFNHQFAGQVQKRGEKPRPVRSKSSLITERYRIPEVCEIAGLKPKVEKKTEEAKSEDDEDRTSDKSKADKGKDPSKRGGRGGRGSRGGRRG